MFTHEVVFVGGIFNYFFLFTVCVYITHVLDSALGDVRGLAYVEVSTFDVH